MASPADSPSNLKIGIIADTPLQQRLLQQVLSAAGYCIAVNVAPCRFDLQWLADTQVHLWIVDMLQDEAHADLLDSIASHTQARLLIGQGPPPSHDGPDYLRWCQRLLNKVNAQVIESGAGLPDADTLPPSPLARWLAASPNGKDATLPHNTAAHTVSHPLMQATPAQQIWLLCASLGGPQAVKAFLRHLPEGIPAAFIYAQHIDQHCLSALVQALHAQIALPVLQAQNNMPICQGYVYIVPTTHTLQISTQQRLYLHNRPWPGAYSPNLDLLLQHCAQVLGAQMNAIIFSGMAGDAMQGTAFVGEQGGQVWAQTGDSAIQSAMPDAASSTGHVSFRGTPKDMANRLMLNLKTR